MHKLETQLAFFKFNSIINEGILTVTWYVLDEENEGGRCFTDQELNEFQQYTVNRPINFPGNKNYHPCTEEETPYNGIESSLESVSFPSMIILRKTPVLNKIIFECVDIILTNKNDENRHDYNLSFDVIGQINY